MPRSARNAWSSTETRAPPTPSPRTPPATSQPTVKGGDPSMPPLERVFQSTGLTPAAATFTRTSVGAGSGRSTVTSSSTSGPPSDRWRMARTSALPVLDPTLQRREELGGQRAVEGAVVPGHAEVGHGSNGDAVAAVGVRDDYGPLDDGLEVEDGHLRLVDDRRGEDGAVGAGVGDGEGSSAYLVGLEPLAARALREVLD